MTQQTFRNQFRRLEPPTSATFSIAEMSTSTRAYVGMDASGRPSLLVENPNAASREIVRRGLRLQHRASCHVEVAGTARTVTASLVACETDDPTLQEAFISVAEIVLSRLRSAADAEVAFILEELVELLDRPGEPSREGAIGLFAELLVISLARDPLAATRAWRIAVGDRYDFVSGSGRIEVKASGTRERRHRFSLEQTIPDKGTQAFVASTLVLEGSGGTGVRELADRVQTMVRRDPDATMKIQRAVIATMGLPRSREPIFDEAHAITRLRWYNVLNVPAIRDVPDDVDQVSFRVSLENAAAITPREIEQEESVLSPCLPSFD